MEDSISKPVGIGFLTDSQVDLLVAYFKKEEVISRKALLNGGFGLSPERIRSLVLSNILDEIGEGNLLRYRPGKLFYAVRTFYRYGSKFSAYLLQAYRTKEDWERAYLFRPGDVVSKIFWDDYTGVVMDVSPFMRKILVRWPFGTELEDADSIMLNLRDNGMRQVNIPAIDKDIIDDYPHNNFSLDSDEYKLEKDKYYRYNLAPLDTKVVVIDKEKDNKRSSSFTSAIHIDKKIESVPHKVKYSGDIDKFTSGRLKRISNSLIKYGTSFDELNSEYLLTQSEIIVSCNIEKSNPSYSKTPWYVTPNTSMNINDNGNGWTSELLAKTYHTFRGSYNFYEHDQNIEKSKGRVIDAVLRKVPINNSEFYYAVEILVATNRKHKNLVSRIESGDLKTLSMGCSATYTVCSMCGNVSFTQETRCDHVMYQRGKFFYDKDGNKRVIAELCGSEMHPDSVEFEEASFVEVPAWRNAKVHNIIARNTSLVNVVGYLSTRLYNKDSVEFILKSGVENLNNSVSKLRSSSNSNNSLITPNFGEKIKAQDSFDFEESEVEDPTGDTLMKKNEVLKFELGEESEEKTAYEGLMEENIRTS